MALNANEQRLLAGIEETLAAEEPELARTLSAMSRTRRRWFRLLPRLRRRRDG